MGPTWLEETEETSVLCAELDASESSISGFPQTVSMMQARNWGAKWGGGDVEPPAMGLRWGRAPIYGAGVVLGSHLWG